MPTRADLEALKQAYSEKINEAPTIRANEGVDEVYGGLPAWAKFAKGARAGVANAPAQIMNMFGMDDSEYQMPDWLGGQTVRTSDTGLKESARSFDEKGLGGWGTAGKIGGEVLSTLPLGGVAGKGLTTGLNLAARAVPRASGAVNTIARLGSTPLGRSAGQGATYGATFAGPDERMRGAATGAVLNPALGKTMSVAKKALGPGLVRATEGAKDLMKKTGEFMPLHLAAEDGLTKTIYQHVLRAVPGVGKHLNAQRDKIVKSWEGLAQNRGLPVYLRDKLYGSKNPYDVMGTLTKFFKEEAYAPISKYAINPKMIDQSKLLAGARDLGKSQKKLLGKIIAQELPSKGNPTVQNLFNVRNRIEDAGIKLGRNVKVSEWIDEVIKKNLSTQKVFDPNKAKTKAEQEIVRYLDLKEPYASFKVLQEAVKGASPKGGEFTPMELARKAAGKAPTVEAAQGRGILEDVARMGTKGMDPANLAAPKPGFFQQAAVNMPVLAGASQAGAAGLPIAAGAWGAARGAVSPSFQRWLMGLTPSQQKVVEMIQKNPELIKQLGVGTRNAAVDAAVQ